MSEHPRIDQQRHRRQTRTLIGILAAIPVFLGLAWLVGQVGDTTSATESQPSSGSAEVLSHHVVYEVGGSTIQASVTLSTPTGTQQLDANARAAGDDLHEMNVDSGEFLYISAQNQNEMGTIVCRIIVDGVVVAENESTASYGIATCEGTAD